MATNDYDVIYAVLHDGTNKKLAKKYLKRATCPPELLSLFASDDYAEAIWGKNTGPKFQHLARKNPKLPREEIEKFLALGRQSAKALHKIKSAIANSAVTSDDIRELLNAAVSDQDKTHVLLVCASHPNLPLELHEVVVKHNLYYIRSHAAMNRRIAKESLTNLLYDENYKVQLMAIKNGATPQNEVVKFLHSIDESPETLPQVSIIRAILVRLPDGDDLQKALRLLNLHPSEQRSNSLTVASYTTDTLILKEKVQDRDPEVRAHAIFNPATLEEDRVVGSLLDTPIVLNSRGTVIKPRKQWVQKKAGKTTSN